MTEEEPTRTIKLRRYPWDASTEISVDLVTEFDADRWKVVLDGKDIGSVWSYTGTLDRPTHRGSRIVTRGKQRKLWGAGWRRDMVSRAEAIRVLLAEQENLDGSAPKP